MPKRKTSEMPDKQVVGFLARIFGINPKDFLNARVAPVIPSDQKPDVSIKMAGVIARRNQPEFWADIPWRIEPDQNELLFILYLRDADIQPPGKGPWRLDMINLEQKLPDDTWYKIRTFMPKDLPDVDEQGLSQSNFWTFSTKIPLNHLRDVKRGDTVRLRATFIGSYFPFTEYSNVEIHLVTYVAEYALPLSRAANQADVRNWYYGDTHYHSAYTNDIKEYGGPIEETREAARSIGLDWMVITDHSTDLDETDNSGKTRWEQLKSELAPPNISDDEFRYILGEEITLRGRGEKYVHMLAVGDMDEMIEGAFLPDNGGSFKADLYREALEGIIKATLGYPADIPEQLFGKINDFEDVLNMLPEKTLTFAAHPYNKAQVPPAKWDESDLSHPKLTGHEFWNGRKRRSARLTSNPFTKSSWTDEKKLRRNDESRVEKLEKDVRKKWDSHLKQGILGWTSDSELPSHRPVFIAGSDAHGDFNYHLGWAFDYDKLVTNDNALGRVRTVIHLPHYPSNAVPKVSDILAALKKGSCVVTDGPIVEFTVKHNGQIVHMGEALNISGNGNIDMKVKAHSTPEFGKIKEIEVVTYFKGQKEKNPRSIKVKAGMNKSTRLDGFRGYCRVQAKSKGPKGELFCCFTNPVWIRILDGQKRNLQISFQQTE